MPSPITRMRSPGERRRLLEPAEDDGRRLGQRGVDERHRGLESMDEPGRNDDLVARPALAGEAELVVRLAGVRRTDATGRATAARHDALGDDAIARCDALDAVTDGLDDARPLVPERQGIADVRRVELAAPELEVGAAETAGGRLDDDLPAPGNEHVALDEPDLPGPFDDERPPHVGTLSPGAPSSAEMRPACSRVAPPSSCRRESGRSSRRPVTLMAPAQPPV